jgi:diguanylate cyclase (GGDEF)-like protein/PAS domain S-box-containing protein
MANSISSSQEPAADNPTDMASEIRSLRDFAELSSDWFWEQDAEFRFTRFFGLSTEKLRRKQSDFIGLRRWDMPISGVPPEQLAEHIATHERHEPFRDFNYQVQGERGTPQYYSVSGTPIFGERGVFIGYHGTGRNVTALRLAELAIKHSERQLSQIVDGSSIATFVIDAEHRITHWNQACANLTGLDAQRMLDSKDVWRAFYNETRPTMANLVVSGAMNEVIAEHYEKFNRSTLIADAVEAEGFFPQIGDDGRWLYFTAAPLRNSDGTITGAIETLQDITEQRTAKDALEQLATRDGLTGVANRRSFDLRLDNEWKRACRDSRTLSLLMIDVDHFKRYNDTYGHLAGDHCLQQISNVLKQVVYRPGDLVARYGGEEFSVILTATDAEGASSVAKRILESIAQLAIPHTGAEGGCVSLSIGVATSSPHPDITRESLIASADKALYQAKRAGRNRIVSDQTAAAVPESALPHLAAQATGAVTARALRDFAELSSDWFWEQDAEFRFTRFFGESTEKLRRKQVDFFGKRRWDMPISGITPEQLAEHIATYERHEPFRNFVYEVPGEGGVPQYYSVSGTPVFNELGAFTGYHGVGRNVTELKLAELAIKESERQLSQIVDGSSIPTFVIDAKHRITHWNQACANLTGLEAKQMLGGAEVWRAFYAAPRPSMADLVVLGALDPAVAEHYRKFNRSTLIAGAVEAEDFFPQMGDDGRWLYFTAAPLRDSDGKITGAIETLQDVTERRRAEKMLEDRTEALQKAYSDLGMVFENLQNTQDELVRIEKLAGLGSMVAGIAHELNTPIGNSLMVATHLVTTSGRITEALSMGLKRSMLEEYLADSNASGDVLVRNLTKAAELVSSFKQVAADQTSSQRRRFELAEMVAEVITTLGPSIRRTPYIVEQVVPTTIRMESYPGPLGQVLTNLINNAIIHAFDGRSAGHIRIVAEQAAEGDHPILLKVIDDGNGMPPEMLTRIFDPFFTTKLGQGGSGLGLNIVHNMAFRVLGGRISVESIPGAGSCFTLNLPLTAPEQDSGQRLQPDAG